MNRKYAFGLLLVFCCSFQNTDFKTQQLKYARVRDAFANKEKMIDDLLAENKLTRNTLQIFIRILKQEKRLELWAKNKNEDQYKILKKYDICSSSGSIGPKRKAGDLQVPEGFYNVNVFNPYSNFHLSLGINYPNASDKILSDKNNPGGNIFIHGSCVTIGCVPLTDDKIKELYTLAVESKNNGQNIAVHIFPTALSDENFEQLKRIQIVRSLISGPI